MPNPSRTASVVEGLSPEWHDALLQFASDDDLLEAENHGEVQLIKDMMEAGLVSYIRAGGVVFMQLRPFGIEVRAHLQAPPMQGEA